jgi:hypothetical protein
MTSALLAGNFDISGTSAALIATTVVGATWLYTKFNSPVLYKKKLNQSAQVSDPKKGETAVYRNSNFEKIVMDFDGMTTIDQLIR